MLKRKEIKLKRYIKRALKKGKTKEEIEELLLKLEWRKETINKIFDKLEKKGKNIEITIPLKRKILKEEPKDEESEPTEVEKKPMGIKGQLDEIRETLDVITHKKKAEKKLKKKRFKLPFKVKSRLKRLAIKNKVQVMLLQRTRNISPVIGEIKEGMLLIGNNVYEGAVKYTWLWRGKFPTFIVPEWDLSPLSKEGITDMRRPIGAGELYKDTIQNKRSAEPQTIILRAIEAKQNQMLKKAVNMKAIIWTVIVTLIIGAVLFGGDYI